MVRKRKVADRTFSSDGMDGLSPPNNTDGAEIKPSSSKKRRGRPSKIENSQIQLPVDTSGQKLKRRSRGRPPKVTPTFSDILNGVDLVAAPLDNSLGEDCDMALVTRVDQPSSKFDHVAKVMPSMDAVVKVFCIHTEPNFSLPWQRKRQFSSSSSGFIISDKRVLTNAHSVEYSTQVKLKKRGSDTKYLATILAIGTECDIGELFSLLN